MPLGSPSILSKSFLFAITGNAQFELVTDASGRTTIKVKKERPPTRKTIFFLCQAEPIRERSFGFLAEVEVTEKAVNLNDFEEVIDAKTGAKVLKLKGDVARRAGMTGLLDAQFETYVDPKTGKQAVRLKQGTNNGRQPSIFVPFSAN